MNRAFTEEYSSLVKENKDLRNICLRLAEEKQELEIIVATAKKQLTEIKEDLKKSNESR